MAIFKTVLFSGCDASLNTRSKWYLGVLLWSLEFRQTIYRIASGAHRWQNRKLVARESESSFKDRHRSTSTVILVKVACCPAAIWFGTPRNNGLKPLRKMIAFGLVTWEIRLLTSTFAKTSFLAVRMREKWYTKHLGCAWHLNKFDVMHITDCSSPTI